jgi:FG-GAP repeat
MTRITHTRGRWLLAAALVLIVANSLELAHLYLQRQERAPRPRGATHGESASARTDTLAQGQTDATRPPPTPTSAGHGWRLSLRALLARTPRDEREVKVTVADLEGTGRKELVAISSAGRAQIWRWNGRRFISILGPRLLWNWGGYLRDRDLCAGDVDGDGKDEILLLSVPGEGDARLRAFGRVNGRLRLKLAWSINADFLMGADFLYRLGGVVRVGPREHFVVARSRNNEAADQNLIFYRLQGGLLQHLPPFGLGALTKAPGGPVSVDLNGNGLEQLVIVSGGELFDPTERKIVPLRLQSFIWSGAAGRFGLDQDTTEFPTALKELFGAARYRNQAFLLGVENHQVVRCRWDGRAFQPASTGVMLSGEPIACGDLLGDGNCEAVTVDANKALWVSPRLLR